MSLLEDEREIRRLALHYAWRVDSGDGEGFADLFADGAVLSVTKGERTGRETLAGIPPGLKAKYLKTYHTLLNSLIDIDGDTATGVTYSLAHHLTPKAPGVLHDHVMNITYHDRYTRTARGWRFAHRRVAVEWTEAREVIDPATLAG